MVDFLCCVNYAQVMLVNLIGFMCVYKIQELVLYEQLALNIKVEPLSTVMLHAGHSYNLLHFI